MLLAAACSDDTGTEEPFSDPVVEEPEPPYKEPVAEQIVFTQANLVYRGAEITDQSDLWELSLLSEEVTVDGQGYPVGPGWFMNLVFNSRPGEEPEIGLLPGSYSSASANNDFSPGTFLWGDIEYIDLPGGTIEMPVNTFIGYLEAGSTEFEPDLLNEKGFRIEDLGDGTFRVSGTMAGTQFLNRHFSYTGGLKIVDRSERPIPQTTLTGDLELDRVADFTRMRLYDCRDIYMMVPHVIRVFEVILAEEGVDLTTRFPAAGSGRMLRLDLCVPFYEKDGETEFSVSNGVPAGRYELLRMIPGTTGIYKEDLVPFGLLPGTPGKFTNPSGSWYRRLVDGELTEYACIYGGQRTEEGVPESQLKWGGTVEVERDGDAHTFTVSLTDYSEEPHLITGRFEMDGFEIY